MAACIDVSARVRASCCDLHHTLMRSRQLVGVFTYHKYIGLHTSEVSTEQEYRASPSQPIPNTKYTYNTGQSRYKLLEQWVHLTNHTAQAQHTH